MPYCTPTDLLTRFDAAEIAQRTDREIPRTVTGELLRAAAAGADLSGDWTEAEADRAAQALVVVGRALQDADDTINGYVSARYSLPLDPVPAVLQRVAADLARYYLYDDQVTDPVKDRFDAAIKLLRDVSTGAVSLGADAATGQQPANGATPEWTGAERVWTRGNATGFI